MVDYCQIAFEKPAALHSDNQICFCKLENAQCRVSKQLNVAGVMTWLLCTFGSHSKLLFQMVIDSFHDNVIVISDSLAVQCIMKSVHSLLNKSIQQINSSNIVTTSLLLAAATLVNITVCFSTLLEYLDI